jgi:hypothetical protein
LGKEIDKAAYGRRNPLEADRNGRLFQSVYTDRRLGRRLSTETVARSAIHRGSDVSSTAEFGKTGCQACPQRAQIATEIEAQRRADRHVGAPLQEHLASRPKQANHPVSARVPRSSGKALESSTKTLAISAPFSLLDTNKLALGNLNDCRAGSNFLIH